MAERKTIKYLWITPKWPLPANDGARVATCGLIQNLSSLGDEIDLLAIAGSNEDVREEEAKKLLGVANVYVVRRNSSAISRGIVSVLKHAAALLANPLTPLTMRHYAARHVQDEVNAVLTGKGASAGWDAVVYDGLHPACHAASNGEFAKNYKAPLVVYRAHNCEAQIWERKSKQLSRGIMKKILEWQTGLVRRFERSVVANVDRVVAVSPQDLKLLTRDAPVKAGNVIPIGFEFDSFPDRRAVIPGQMLFLGRLDWLPNSEGLKWLLDNVWPAVVSKREDLKLVIAGSGDGSWLARYHKLPGLDVRGFVENPSELFKESVVSLVPLFVGSGTRVKVIEACKYGCPCISTALGVEGIGLQEGKQYLRAESVDQWEDIILNIEKYNLKEIGYRAFRFARINYSAERAARNFRKFVSNSKGVNCD
ncbi:MAG: glycosyltransferase [Candidatus Dadabacteria bacterium]|nr:MAG: glycosyltransferase [Candidatus Dadabacteria bacterium]